MTSSLYDPRDDEDEGVRPWSMDIGHHAKRARMHVDHDAPRAWEHRPDSRLRAEYTMPGFNPGNPAQFGSFGLPTGYSGIAGPAASQYAEINRGIATGRISIDGSPALSPAGPPPPSSRAIGTSRAMERVTTTITARPFFAPHTETFMTEAFPIGSLVMILKRRGDRETMQAAFQETGNFYVVATLPQCRTIEASHTMYAERYPKEMGIGVNPDTEPATFQVVSIDGSPVPPGTGGRDPCLHRWVPAGVVVTVDSSTPGFVNITLCVQGPTMMRNYFWPDIAPGTQVYLRGVTQIPPGYGTSAADAISREALTIKTIDVWPNFEAGSQYVNLLDDSERDNGQSDSDRMLGLAWDLHMLGAYQWMEPPIGQTMKQPPATLNTGGTFYDSEMDGIVVLGKILDRYDHDVSPDLVPPIDTTGFVAGSVFGRMGVKTRTYGDLRINLVAHMGLTPLQIAVTNMRRATRPVDDGA